MHIFIVPSPVSSVMAVIDNVMYVHSSLAIIVVNAQLYFYMHYSSKGFLFD